MAKNASTRLRLEYLLAELEGNRLITVLVPQKRYTNECGMIRVNMSVNPKWYQALCSRHPSKRAIRRGKHDTVIRRHRIEQTLRTMIRGGKHRSLYADELIEIALKLKIHAA